MTSVLPTCSSSSEDAWPLALLALRRRSPACIPPPAPLLSSCEMVQWRLPLLFVAQGPHPRKAGCTKRVHYLLRSCHLDDCYTRFRLDPPCCRCKDDHREQQCYQKRQHGVRSDLKGPSESYSAVLPKLYPSSYHVLQCLHIHSSLARTHKPPTRAQIRLVLKARYIAQLGLKGGAGFQLMTQVIEVPCM